MICDCQTDSEHDEHMERLVAEHEEMLSWERYTDQYGQSYYIDETEPRCDECGILMEETVDWDGICGNCPDHCAHYVGCPE